MSTDGITAEDVLIAHQRRDNRSCICGWAELGKSHPAHQVKMLAEAGLLETASVAYSGAAVSGRRRASVGDRARGSDR